METISGVVDAVRKDRKGLCINDVWYSSWDALTCNKGDEVVFNSVAKGRFNNIKGKVNVASSGGGGSASRGPSGGGYSNLGVELGHASNLAMRMMEQEKWDVEMVGSKEYFSAFTKYTMDVYKVMKHIRESVSTKSESETKTATPTKSSDDEDNDGDDLF